MAVNSLGWSGVCTHTQTQSGLKCSVSLETSEFPTLKLGIANGGVPGRGFSNS